jgi:hypothetical protein
MDFFVGGSRYESNLEYRIHDWFLVGFLILSGQTPK